MLVPPLTTANGSSIPFRVRTRNSLTGNSEASELQSSKLNYLPPNLCVCACSFEVRADRVAACNVGCAFTAIMVMHHELAIDAIWSTEMQGVSVLSQPNRLYPCNSQILDQSQGKYYKCT